MTLIDTAVFPVGGLGTRILPATKAFPKEMLPVVDRPLIQYAVEEAKQAGIKRFIFITAHGKKALEDHFDRSEALESRLKFLQKDKELKLILDSSLRPGEAIFVRQQQPLGLGHAVWCARQWVGNKPFAVILPDDLILGKPCLKEMIDHYRTGNMVGVMDIEPQDSKKYGILDVLEDDGRQVVAKGVVEKPSPEKAPSTVAVVGRYIIDPFVFELLKTHTVGTGGEIQLTDALSAMIKVYGLTGFRFSGKRFDCGDKKGWLEANIACACENELLKDAMQEILARYLKKE
ncbi:MAG TPA: UTP--glucose-1-phosphate uridylyltransferase [Alphaproteobacteria bacterium]|nr:UTP--glucose-1-phosphate uridylyltransferase [Alphaproteobacteria bacterium]